MSDAQPVPAAFLDGVWRHGGGALLTRRGPLGEDKPPHYAADAADVDLAMRVAHRGALQWALVPFAERLAVLQRFAALAAAQVESAAAILAAEVGKPLWECREEARALAGKVALTEAAFVERAAERTSAHAGFVGRLRYRPHGVFAVLSPYNLPLHLPNGHIVPALLAGNAVVLKAHELTPRSAVLLVELLLQAGLPPDAIGLLPGDRATGEALIAHPLLAAVAFTGSSQVGRAIHRALGGRTEVLAALEMGGNNPMVVLPGASPPTLLGELVVLSSLLTTGQRCTSARRLIVPRGAEGDAVVEAVVSAAAALRIAPAHAAPEPFCGPLVDAAAADRVVAAVAALERLGATSLLPMRRLPWSPAALSPAILDVSACAAAVPDDEIFGPALQVYRVDSRDEAFARAAATRYGLSAALIGGTSDDFAAFRAVVPAGIINHNRPTNGALSTQPFGGTGWSGNHRPAGWTSVDYCCWAAASTEAEAVALPEALPPGMRPVVAGEST